MEVSRHWRLKAQRYRLVGSICPVCGRLAFPPRPVCPDCITQPARNDSFGPSVLLTLLSISDIESLSTYQFIERTIR